MWTQKGVESWEPAARLHTLPVFCNIHDNFMTFSVAYAHFTEGEMESGRASTSGALIWKGIDDVTLLFHLIPNDVYQSWIIVSMRFIDTSGRSNLVYL